MHAGVLLPGNQTLGDVAVTASGVTCGCNVTANVTVTLTTVLPGVVQLAYRFTVPDTYLIVAKYQGATPVHLSPLSL